MDISSHEARERGRGLAVGGGRGAVAGGGGGVMQGAEHAGDIAQRRAFGPAVFQALGRLAFEIDDIGVARGDEHLAEMEIAMDARGKRADGGFREVRQQAQDLFRFSNTKA